MWQASLLSEKTGNVLAHLLSYLLHLMFVALWRKPVICRCPYGSAWVRGSSIPTTLSSVKHHRRISPRVEIDSLLFGCEYTTQGKRTLTHPIHGTDVPSNRQCLILPSDPPGKPIGEATLDLHTIGTGLVPQISQVYIFGSCFNYYSRIEILILDCGEDPESITLAEINSKLHWFVFYENGELAAHNWAEIVSPSLLGVH